MSQESELKQKIIEAIKNIQDNVDEGTKGLSRPDVKNDMVFWELGVLLKEFVNSKSIPDDNITDELNKNFKKIEKKIRSEGIRKGKESLPTWLYKDQNSGKMKEQSETWVLWSWEFVYEYQDLERWKLVVKLAYAQEGFNRKRVQDLVTYFSKRDPIPNAKKLQEKFIQEIENICENEKRPPRRESEFEPLIREIFRNSKSKINYRAGNKHCLRINRDVDLVIDEENGSEKARKEFSKNIGLKAIDSLRRLLRLVSITDETKYAKRLKIPEVKKLGKSIQTKDSDVKELYQVLFSLKDDEKSRKNFLKKPGTSKHDLTMLNSKLAAVVSEESYEEYIENQKAKNSFFS
tara:strand:+ start:2470 stop:3513 length:1044 start_codon:yes stop_codon:yes gene_type:complete